MYQPKMNCSLSSGHRTRRLRWTPASKCWQPTSCWSMQRSVCVTLCDLIRYQQLKEFGIVHSAKEFIQLFHPNEQEDTP